MKRNFLLPNNDQLICTHKAAIFTFSAPCMVLSTAANLDNMVVLTKTWNSISITAAVSAGADVNALCAGDPAILFESDEEPCILSPGTINIFLITNHTLSPGAMTELLMTITEAKTTVLRDFMQGSSASNSISKEYSLSLDAISALAEHFDKDSFCITEVSLYVHLLDQCRSDMLTEFEISDWSNYLLQAMKAHYSCNFSIADELDPLKKLQIFFESLLRNYIEEEKRYKTLAKHG